MKNARAPRCLALAALALVLGPLRLDASVVDPYKEVNASWDRFGAVYNRILENYYADLDQEQIMRAAIDGMLKQLDSYSQFYDEEGLRQLRQDTSGKFAGLGITVGIRNQFPVVIAPIEDTPAQRAGLKAGDRIVAIEGRSTYDLGLEEVVHLLRGDPGTSVGITVSRQGTQPDWDLVIERAIVTLKSVVLVEEVEPGIGYISLRGSRFSEDTADEVEEALNTLKEQEVQATILDLRGNPGGLLSQATEVADLFLPRNAPIVSIRERDGRREEMRRSQRRPVAEEMPLAVLIDAGSASASEIVAGAIQDNDRGVILGTPSFGKGSVQTIFDLTGAESSALKLTTALYYTPSGRSIHRESFSPIGAMLSQVSFGGVDLPAGVTLDLVLRAPDKEWVVTALRTRFGLAEHEIEQVLSTSLSELAGKVGTERAAPADSAEHAFQTLRGRTVYGRGGIAPDISVEAPQAPRFVQELDRRQVFFEFVVDYVSGDSLLTAVAPTPDVDGAMLEAFRNFVRVREPDLDRYEAASGELKGLERLADGMGWGAPVRAALDSLGAAIAAERERGFSPALEPFLRRALARELALSLEGKRASMRAMLRGDAQFESAVRLLRDPGWYRRVLHSGAS